MDPPRRVWRDLLPLPVDRRAHGPICGTGLYHGISSARPLEQAVCLVKDSPHLVRL